MSRGSKQHEVYISVIPFDPLKIIQDARLHWRICLRFGPCVLWRLYFSLRQSYRLEQGHSILIYHWECWFCQISTMLVMISLLLRISDRLRACHIMAVMMMVTPLSRVTVEWMIGWFNIWTSGHSINFVLTRLSIYWRLMTTSIRANNSVFRVEEVNGMIPLHMRSMNPYPLADFISALFNPNMEAFFRVENQSAEDYTGLCKRI